MISALAWKPLPQSSVTSQRTSTPVVVAAAAWLLAAKPKAGSTSERVATAANFRCAALPAGFGICFTMVLSECRSPRFPRDAEQADSSLVIGLVDPAAVIEHCLPELLTSGSETRMPRIGCLHTPSLVRIDSDLRTSCWRCRRVPDWVIVAQNYPSEGGTAGE